MLSKNAPATNVDSILPADTLFTMVEEEFSLDRVELWEFLKVCPGLSAEDKKTLLLLFFLTRTKKDSRGELDSKVLQIWNEIEKCLNLAPRKKSLCQLVKELPGLWKKPCRKFIRSNNTDDNACPSKYKTRISRNKINIFQLQHSFTFIKVTSKVSTNSGQTLTLIIDTGASVSVIKADVIDPRMVVVMKQKVEFVGIIRNELVESLGTCNIPLCHGDKNFAVDFNIVSQTKNLPFDGVLGRNFFEEHQVSINYEKQVITLKDEGWMFPFFNQMASFSHKFAIPGHSERTVQAVVKHTNVAKGYMPQCELAPGIFLRRTIAKLEKYPTVTATISNMHHCEQDVDPFCIELLPLPKYVEKDWAIVEKEMILPQYREYEAKYQYFIRNIDMMEAWPELHVQEFNPELHTPNALFCPMNIDKIRVFSKIVNTVYKPYLAKPPGLHKVTKYFTPTMITYLCTDRYLYIEQPSSKDSFFTLCNLKEKLVKEKYSGQFCILELNRVRQETPRVLFFRMIQHIFEGTDIDPIVVIRTIQTPKNQEEKTRVIGENHIGKKNKHLGFLRTYNQLRDGYTWSTMKEDVMQYMLACQKCNYNLTQFKSQQTVLPPKAGQKNKEEQPLKFNTAC